MADHSKPTLTSNYSTEFIPQLDGRFDDLTLGLDPARTSPTNLPQYAIRWSSAAKKWQIWSGTAWGDLESEYAINIGGSAVKLKTKRTFQISGGATAAAVEFDGGGNVNLNVTEVDGTKVTAATTTNKGAVELATNAETQTGADSERAVTAAALSSRTATETRTGLVELATDAEAVTGTDATRAVTPRGVAAAMSAAEDDLQWLGTPIGGYITPKTAPPKDDPRFRYVLCTAGETGSGKYNEGILTDESVTGSAPLVVATAKVSLAGSPFDGLTIHHINTEGRFVGAGTAEAFEDDSLQNITGTFNTQPNSGAAAADTLFSGAFYEGGAASTFPAAAAVGPGYAIGFDASLVARTSDRTQPRAHRLPHYRRIK